MPLTPQQLIEKWQSMIQQKRCPMCGKRGAKFRVFIQGKTTRHGLKIVHYLKRGTHVNCPHCKKKFDVNFTTRSKTVPADKAMKDFIERKMQE